MCDHVYDLYTCMHTYMYSDKVIIATGERPTYKTYIHEYIHTDKVIIATGGRPKYLGLPNEE